MQASDLLDKFPEAVHSFTDTDHFLRGVTTKLALEGVSPEKITADYQISESALRSWVNKLLQHKDWEALATQPRSGRPPKLTEDQINLLDGYIQQGPEACGYCVWDGKALADFIAKKFNVSYSPRHCLNLLKKMGYTLVRPQIFPALGEENQRDRVEYFEKIDDLDVNSIQIVWEDEVHFSNQTTVTRPWVKKGSKPKVKSAPTNKGVPFFGFATPETGDLFTTKPNNPTDEKDNRFNYLTTIQAIRDFLANREDRTKMPLIILDNASWHKKAVRIIQENEDGAYFDILNECDFLFLPPKSPDLNPTEQVWRKTRREVTHNRYFANRSVVEEKLSDYFEKLTSTPEGKKELSKFLSFKNYSFYAQKGNK